MSKSNSIQSFPHCKEIWDAAYASPTGSILVSIESMTKNDQHSLVGDLLQYRVLVRKENTKFYPPGHPEYMTSIFDPFTVQKVLLNGDLYIRIRRRDAKQFKIEIEDVE